MKMKKILYFTLMYLPMAINLSVLSFLPDKVPVHYGYVNQVSRWGSKYEILIIALMAVLTGYLTLAVAKSAARQEKHGSNNEKITLVTGIFVLILFNAINVYFIYTASNKIENLSSVPLDISRLVFCILGVFMIVMGNFMPKLRKNSMIGLRTKWSMKNDAVWKKCQRIGGISLIAGGIMTIGACIVTKGNSCLILSLSIWGILTVVDVFATYRIAEG